MNAAAAPRLRSGARARSLPFAVLDGVFLALVGASSLVAMHSAHDLEWPFAVEALIGMVAAMAVQVLLALLVAPLLGSIESMVPSMIVAMLAPMSLCGLHMLGIEPARPGCTALGAVLGLVASMLLHGYGRRCRRRFASGGGRPFP